MMTMLQPSYNCHQSCHLSITHYCHHRNSVDSISKFSPYTGHSPSHSLPHPFDYRQQVSNVNFASCCSCCTSAFIHTRHSPCKLSASATYLQSFQHGAECCFGYCTQASLLQLPPAGSTNPIRWPAGSTKISCFPSHPLIWTWTVQWTWNAVWMVSFPPPVPHCRVPRLSCLCFSDVYRDQRFVWNKKFWRRHRPGLNNPRISGEGYVSRPCTNFRTNKFCSETRKGSSFHHLLPCLLAAYGAWKCSRFETYKLKGWLINFTCVCLWSYGDTRGNWCRNHKKITV